MGYGQRKMLQPEQKSVELMRYLVQKLSDPADCVSGAYTGVPFTAKECLLLEKDRISVGCPKDSGCMDVSITGIVEVYIFPLLNDKSDLNGGVE